jgi:hypothetical protein
MEQSLKNPELPSLWGEQHRQEPSNLAEHMILEQDSGHIFNLE